jgi:hypothetical protein
MLLVLLEFVGGLEEGVVTGVSFGVAETIGVDV